MRIISGLLAALLVSVNSVYGRSLLATATASSSASSTAVATNGGSASSSAQSSAQAAAVGSGNAAAVSTADSTAVADGAGSVARSDVASRAEASAGSGESNDATALTDSLAEALGVNAQAYSSTQSLAQALSERVQLPFFWTGPAQPQPQTPGPQVAGTQAQEDPVQTLPPGLLYIIQFLSKVNGQVVGADSTCPSGYVQGDLAGVPVYVPQDLDRQKCLSAFASLCDSIVDQVREAIEAQAACPFPCQLQQVQCVRAPCPEVCACPQ